MGKIQDWKMKQIKRYLKNAIKWQLESMENLKNQYFVITAGQFATGYTSDLGMFLARSGIEFEDEEWEKLYMECSEEARKDFLEEHK